MINLTKGQTESIYTTTNGGGAALYYFKFTNRTTNDVKQMWLNNLSTKARFQKFTFDVDDFFDNFIEGFYTYTIQVATANNVVPTTAVLETGYMKLNPATEFAPIKYNEQSNQFKVYNG
jgi:hypothetical protein